MKRPDRPHADASAFCAAEWPQLVRALSLDVGDPYVAEELAQEALLRAIVRRPFESDVGRLPIWRRVLERLPDRRGWIGSTDGIIGHVPGDDLHLSRAIEFLRRFETDAGTDSTA